MGNRDRHRKRTGGQGLTEYIIVVALVAVAAIGVVNLMGNQLRHQFATIVAAMAGHRSVMEEDLSGDAGKEANERTLRNYATRPGSKSK